MIPIIGEKVMWGDKVYHVQDRSLLSSRALIGIPDENDIIWTSIWVDFDDLVRRDDKWQSLVPLSKFKRR